ncbi:MAG: class A beta-lactamase [Gammaproteobacteria bacterium]
MSTAPLSRRALLQVCVGVSTMSSVGAGVLIPDRESSLSRMESQLGGRVGVFALDTGSGKRLAHRENERFAMCSTFKWVLAAATLASVESGGVSLDEELDFDASDILEYAPITARHVAEGKMTVRALCSAMITVSDNTAANLLFRKLGGPGKVTAFARSCGDSITRMDRIEPDLNENAHGDPRDTTTPRAMVELMRRVLGGKALAESSRDLLVDWMVACETGMYRLRAGVPQDWRVGDKTGSGQRGASNDVAIFYPPGRMPILVAVYMSESDALGAAVAAAQARIASLIVQGTDGRQD